MLVAQLLEGKSKGVVTLHSDESVVTAAQTLAKHRIGAIVVCDDNGKVEGILSERDIVAKISRDGCESLGDPIASCMSTGVVACQTKDTVNDLMEVMTNNRFRHLPVVDQGNLVGIISIGDMVKYKIEQAERDAEDLRSYIAS